jgi:CPA2 family monovalent cation:H+ antiporter-2
VSLFEQIILLLLTTIIMLSFLRLLRMPSVIGYLLVGLILGPAGMSWLGMGENVHLLAEFGIVFLLFSIGLEVSLTRLAALKKSILFGGGVQVLVCTIVPGAIAWLLGMQASSAFLAAGALSLSSTAVVAKQFAEQQELNEPHGQLSLAILLFQDLAAIPFLIITHVLAIGHTYQQVGMILLWALAKGLCAVTLLLIIGRYLLRPLFHPILRSDSSELLIFTSLFIALASAWLTSELGLSMALGAFTAGLVLGETEFRHQLAADIRPFKDVFLALFFVTIGMLLDAHVLMHNWYWVLWLLISVIVFKFILVAAVSRWSARVNTRASLRTGVSLAQVGEFGFVLLALGVNLGSIEKDYGQVILAASILSLFIAPYLVRHNEIIANRILTFFKKDDRDK